MEDDPYVTTAVTAASTVANGHADCGNNPPVPSPHNFLYSQQSTTLLSTKSATQMHINIHSGYYTESSATALTQPHWLWHIHNSICNNIDHGYDVTINHPL